MVGESAVNHAEAGKQDLEWWPVQPVSLVRKAGLLGTVSGRMRPAI